MLQFRNIIKSQEKEREKRREEASRVAPPPEPPRPSVPEPPPPLETTQPLPQTPTPPPPHVETPPFQPPPQRPVPLGVPLAQTPQEEVTLTLEPLAPELHKMVSAVDVYGNMMEFVNGIAERLNRGDPVTNSELVDKVGFFLDEIIKSKAQFGALIGTETPENYPVGHMIGTCILSLHVGMKLGYDRTKLIELGTGALLFDVGMTKVLGLSKEKRRLGSLEFDEIKKHPEYSAKLLENISDLPQSAIDIALQHHERPDGKGYPFGLTSSQISEFSKVVKVADTYMALTHSRPQRPGLTPHEAIKEIMQDAALFSPQVLRALLRVISVYPVGTWVELNSRDIGRVMRLNPEQPLRPVLELVCDRRGQRFESKKVTDLLERPQLYITGVVGEDDLKKWGLL